MRRAFPAVLALAAACSTAGQLGYDEIAGELDAIVHVEGRGEARRLRFADRAAVAAWYMRWSLFAYVLPIRPLLGAVFGPTRVQTLEQPSLHVRELLRELPYKAGSSPDRCVDGVVRLLRIAELDPNPANRVVALDAACRLFDALGCGTLEGGLEALARERSEAEIRAAEDTVRRCRPGNRTGALSAADRASYAEALERLTATPRFDGNDRLGLLTDLHACWRNERDAELRALALDAMRRGVGHAVRGALVQAMRGRDLRHAGVRLCAMQSLRRLDGPEAVPYILAFLAEPSSGTTGIIERFDRDEHVLLRLIHLCGQLHGDLAERAVALPGRETWDLLSPLDFLARIALQEQAYYSKLRVPALWALALSTDRPRLDFDARWVEEWYPTWKREE